MSSCREINASGLAALGRIFRNRELCQFSDATGLNLPCPPPDTRLIHALIDRKVLCEIACCCLQNPNISSSGASLYQNCVHDTIKMSNSVLPNLGGLYRSEVGYRMTNPPVPRPVPRDQRPSDYPGDGTVRVDVVSTLDPDNPSTDPSNIYKIYEMKFPNDPVNQGQLKEYGKIADTELIDVKNDCDCKNDGKKVLEAANAYAIDKMRQANEEMNKRMTMGVLGTIGALLGGVLLGGAAPELVPVFAY